jgi:HD-like signal output (HDOD) protein
MIAGAALTELITLGQVRVPPAPASAVRIQRRVLEDDCSLDELVQIASLDPALSAAVLGLANGGGPQPPASLREAVERIGVDELVRVALAVDAADAAATSGPLASLRLLAWRRSVTCAFVCRFVAERRGLGRDDAFGCGLLHDFGWIVALCALEDLLTSRPEEQGRSAESWLRLVDQFHILLGHITAVRWNLPPLFCDVILCHHDPAEAQPDHRPMVELVAACDRLVLLLEQQPSVSAADIARVAGFGPELAGPLVDALPRIAASTARLLEVSPASPAAPSKVVRRPRGRPAQMKEVDWDLAWIGAGAPVPGRVTAASPDGMVARLPRAPRENYIVKLAIGRPGAAPLEVLVIPVLVEDDGGEQRIEARLFALAGDHKRIWEEMIRTA